MLHKEATQQRMLLAQPEEAADATYSLQTVRSRSRCPVWPCVEELEFTLGMEKRAVNSQDDFFS